LAGIVALAQADFAGQTLAGSEPLIKDSELRDYFDVIRS
jgi:hypothetical protein